MAEQQFYTLITNVGQAKLANATALGTKVNFAKLQVGDGKDYNPNEAQENLKHKVWEGSINSITTDSKNPNWIVIQTLIPASVGGFNINEVGVFDDEGNMLVVSKYPSTYKPKLENGSGKDLTIKLVIQVSNVDSVTLKVDPTVILATKKDIENVKNIVNENNEQTSNNISNIQKQISNIDLSASKVKLESKDYESKNVGNALEEVHTTIGNKTLLQTKDKTNLVCAINEVFQSASNSIKQVNNNKTLLKNAVAGKGVEVQGDSFESIKSGIDEIKVGDYKKGDWIYYSDIGLSSPNTYFQMLPSQYRRDIYNIFPIDNSSKIWFSTFNYNDNLLQCVDLKTNTMLYNNVMTVSYCSYFGEYSYLICQDDIYVIDSQSCNICFHTSFHNATGIFFINNEMFAYNSTKVVSRDDKVVTEFSPGYKILGALNNLIVVYEAKDKMLHFYDLKGVRVKSIKLSEQIYNYDISEDKLYTFINGTLKVFNKDLFLEKTYTTECEKHSVLVDSHNLRIIEYTNLNDLSRIFDFNSNKTLTFDDKQKGFKANKGNILYNAMNEYMMSFYTML